jgi:hypothetical protein
MVASGVEKCEDRGICWHSQAVAPALLLDFIGPALRGEPVPGRMWALKESRRRQVFALSAPGFPTVVVKRYPRRSSLALRSRERWRSRAAVEFQTARRLRELQIPTPLPLAHGVDLGAGAESYYVSLMVSGSQALGPLLEKHCRAGDRRPFKNRLLRRGVALLRTLHESGFYHRDAHGGNFLLRYAEGPAGRLWLIDLPSLVELGAVPEVCRARDLADFLFSLRHVLDREEMASWLDQASDPEVSLPSLQAALHKKERAHARSRASRAWVESSAFTQDSPLPGLVSRRREWTSEEVEVLQQAHEQAVESGEQSVLRLGSRSRLSIQRTAQGQAVLVKEFHGRSGGNARRARRCFQGGVELAVRDLSAPRALAVWAREHGSSYVMSEALEDAVPLHLLAYRHDGQPDSVLLSQSIADQVRALLVGLIQRHLYHPDLSPKNLLVQQKRTGEVTVQLVDWDGIDVRSLWTRRRILRALVQVGDVPHTSFSRPQRLRFLRQLVADLKISFVVGQLARDTHRLLLQRRKLEETLA